MPITPQRKERLMSLARNRQPDLTVVLENVHDPHNIGAVLRSCDSIGIGEIHVIYTDPDIDIDNIKMGKRSSAGTRKWVDVHLYKSVQTCLQRLQGFSLLGAYLDEASPSLFDLDLSRKVALVFGNEHEGITDELRQHLDGYFFIPQVGMVKSLNISVACAVTLYEAMRQRMVSGMYDAAADDDSVEALFDSYVGREGDRLYGQEPFIHED